jgi:beta-glucanase (GH16 family)
MKTSLLVKPVLAIYLFLFLVSCQKNILQTPETSPTPIPTSDTGTYYTAKTVCNYNDSTLISSGWTKTFEDNFDSGLSKWSVLTGGSASPQLQSNPHLQYYKESNILVANGILQIVAKKETVTNTVNGTQKTYDFTSGQIESKSTFSANDNTPKVRIVARIKLPKGYGMHPVFLTVGNNWPTQGQIEMIRANGNETNFYSTNYHYGNVANNNLVSNAHGFIRTDTDLAACYHTYETEWTKNVLNFYLDGNLVEQKTSGGYIPKLFGKTHRLYFYTIISSELLTSSQIETGTLFVDWVRVYTSK